MARRPAAFRRTATHVAAFAAGAATAVAVAARADRAQERYRTLDAFAQALSLIRRHHVDAVGERELVYGAIEGMVSRLDAHSRFYSPRRYRRMRQDTEGEFGGVGLHLRKAEPGADPPYPVIEDVVPGSPARRAGLAVGMRVSAIAGKATARAGQKQRRAHSFHNLLRGRPGTAVSLDVVKRGGGSRHVELLRERIKVPSVESFAFDDRIGYIRVRRFQEATARDVAAALVALGGARLRGLVFDLRNNPGGLLDQGIAVADLFIDGGVLVQVKGRGDKVLERPTASSKRTRFRAPMVALVDRTTASAAEIVAAALEDHGRATLVGQPTYGKGSVQTFYDLADGSGIKITTARYVSPGGRVIQGAGIVPDHRVEPFRGEVMVAGKAPSARSVKQRWPHLDAGLIERLDADNQLLEAYATLRKEVN